jgi:hypothetical protein
MKLRDFIDQLKQLDPESDTACASTLADREERIRGLVREINREIAEDGKKARITSDQIRDALFDEAEMLEPEIKVKDIAGRRTVCLE